MRLIVRLSKGEQLALFGAPSAGPKATVKGHVRKTKGGKATMVMQHQRKTQRAGLQPGQPLVWSEHHPTYGDIVVSRVPRKGRFLTPAGRYLWAIEWTERGQRLVTTYDADMQTGHGSFTGYAPNTKGHRGKARYRDDVGSMIPTEVQDVAHRLSGGKTALSVPGKMAAAKEKPARTTPPPRPPEPVPTTIEPASDGWRNGPWWGNDPTPGGYVHIIRGPNDPERRTRKERQAAMGVEAAASEWVKVKKHPADWWAKQIGGLVADGQPRTFNHIMVELADSTADIAFTTPADHGLWQLVASGRVEHTNTAPILFRAVEASTALGGYASDDPTAPWSEK